ncbi:MAG: DUF2750 domain-containing protein [Hyphomicrobium sp.]
MLAAPRIPELGQRDRFVRRAVKEGRVLTLADEEMASVPSQKYPGRTVQLFWSSPIEAKRWAEALTGNASLQDISVTTFAADILPGLRAAKGLAGTDWVADPIEAEVDPADLQLRLKAEALPLFLRAIAGRGEVYLVAGDDGPLLQSIARRGVELYLLHVFAVRADAERYMKKAGARKIIADSLADFTASTLPWAFERGHHVVMEPIPGAGPHEMTADTLTRLLASA